MYIYHVYAEANEPEMPLYYTKTKMLPLQKQAIF
jgi:hypothetical protein